MEDDQQGDKLLLTYDCNSPQDKDSKVLSRELKSLIDSAKESKIINESTQIVHKIRKSRKDIFDTTLPESPSDKVDQSRASSANSSSSELSQQKDAKRSMRSQNSDFVIKQKKFLKAVSGKPDLSDDNTDIDIDDSSKVSTCATPERQKMYCPIKISLDRYGCKLDPFCWCCHRENASLHCSNCPRSYHQKCLPSSNKGPNSDNPWACHECVIAMNTSDTSKRSPLLKNISLLKFCDMLRIALQRMMDVKGSEPFHAPVNPDLFPDYSKYVVNPTDLSKLKVNIEKKMYGSTEAFTSDAKWILHNCIIFNSGHCKLTNISRSILKACKSEMRDIETCPECYLNANTRENWFTHVCERPHILLWAKLKSFPYWPAKGMAYSTSGTVDVRFFGDHDRAWIPAKDCYLYSRKDPNLNNKSKKNDIQRAILEVHQYIHNIKTKFGAFNHAPFKTLYVPTEQENQLKILIPNYNSPEGYKHPNFSISSPPVTSRSKASSPGFNAVANNFNKNSTPISNLNMQPKVVLSHTKIGGHCRSMEFDSDNDDDNPTVDIDANSSKEDSSIETGGTEIEGNDTLKRSSRSSSVQDNEKTFELENPGKRKRRTLSEYSSFLVTHDSKKMRTSPDPESSLSKVPPMRSRGKSIDSRMMKEYMNAIAKNETSFKTNVQKSEPSKTTTEQLVIEDKEKSSVEEPQTTKETVSKLSNNIDVPNRPAELIKPNATFPQATGLDTIKVTNICSLSDFKLKEAVAKRLSGVKTLPVSKSKINEPNVAKVNGTISTSDKSSETSTEPSCDTILNDKLNYLNKSNALIVSPVKPAKETVSVKSFARINAKAPVNGALEKLTSQTDNAGPTPANANNSTEQVEVVIKDEPMDFEDVESAKSKSDKNHLLNSLQLKPNEPTMAINADASTNATKKPNSPIKPNSSSVKKYRSAAEIREENNTVSAENSNQCNILTGVKVKTIPNMQKTTKSLKIHKIASKPIPRVCQIQRVSGGKITLEGGSPEKRIINGGLLCTKSNTEGMKTNQMIAIPKNDLNRLQQTISGITLLKTNQNSAAPKATTLLGNALTGNTSPVQATQPAVSKSSPLPVSVPPAAPAQNRVGNPIAVDTSTNIPMDIGLLSPANPGGTNTSPVQTPTVLNAHSPINNTPPNLQYRTSLNAFDGVSSEAHSLLLPSSLGPQQKWINESAVKLSEFFRHLMCDSLNGLALQGSPEAMIRNLQLQLEKIKWQTDQKLKELKHNTDLTIKEIKSSLEGEKSRVLVEQRQVLEAEKLLAVSEAKKKQWCANCEQMSQFYCCWNTSYCGYPCQQAHWPLHMKTCTQPSKDTSPPTTLNRPPVATGQVVNRNKKQVIIARTSVPNMIHQTAVQSIIPATIITKPSTYKVVTNQNATVTSSTPQPPDKAAEQPAELPATKSGSSGMYILGT